MRTSAPGWADLIWLDLHLFRNRIRTVVRNPRRLLPWLLVLAFLVPSLIERVSMAGSSQLAMGGGFRYALTVVAPYLPAAGLVVLGFTGLAAGREGAGGIRVARGRRLLVIGLGMRPRVVLLWLMLRAIRRMHLAAVLYILVLLDRSPVSA